MKMLLLLLSLTLIRSILAEESNPYAKPLTDEEIQMSHTYTSDAYQQRLFDEYCKNNTDKCQGRQTYAFGGTADMIIESASKMMGVFGFMSKFSYNKKMPDGKISTEEATDYCAFIPMGGETVAQGYQTLGQQTINSMPVSTENAQRDNLMKAALAHDKRATTATIQAGIWGVTAGCYTAMTAKQAVTGNVMNWSKGQIANHAVKIAASVGLTGFYWIKRQRAIEARDFTYEVARKLSKASNCNPITEKACYCAQPETKEDVKYCYPEILKNRKGAGNTTPMSCLDTQLRNDPQCQCLASNTCYDMRFVDFPVKLAELNGGVDPMKDVLNMYRGNLSRGSTESATRNLIGAAKKRLGELEAPLNNNSLNKGQKEQAKILEQWGVNKEWAEHLAGRPLGEDEKNLKKFLQQDGDQSWVGWSNTNSDIANKDRYNSGKSHVLTFSGPKGKGNSKSDDNFQNPYDALSKLQEKNKANKQNTKSLQFSQKAEDAATIHAAPQKSLFEIIENRYRSKWEDLHVFD